MSHEECPFNPSIDVLVVAIPNKLASVNPYFMTNEPSIINYIPVSMILKTPYNPLPN